MKKNYVKPSLLSETFVASNIMTGMATDADSFLSAGVDLYLNGKKFEGITFGSGNTIQSISLSDFAK